MLAKGRFLVLWLVPQIFRLYDLRRRDGADAFSGELANTLLLIKIRGFSHLMTTSRAFGAS